MHLKLILSEYTNDKTYFWTNNTFLILPTWPIRVDNAGALPEPPGSYLPILFVFFASNNPHLQLSLEDYAQSSQICFNCRYRVTSIWNITYYSLFCGQWTTVQCMKAQKGQFLLLGWDKFWGTFDIPEFPAWSGWGWECLIFTLCIISFLSFFLECPKSFS